MSLCRLGCELIRAQCLSACSRSSRYMDEDADEEVDSEEEDAIRRQMEEEEEAENADELGAGDMGGCPELRWRRLG